MAALLIGARLVLRQGLRFLPVYRALPAAVPVRSFIKLPRFLTALQDISVPDLHPVEMESVEGMSLHVIGSRMKKTGRISKHQFLRTFENVCKAGTPTSGQAWFFLNSCGSLMPGVPMKERTELVTSVWNKLKEMGVVFNENHYNTLLKVHVENEHTFSVELFLAEMGAAKIQLNQTTYENMIAAYCSQGDLDGASQILTYMRTWSVPITDDVFNSLLIGHGRAGNLEGTKNILCVMQESGLTPGKSTYLTLACVYAEKGDIEMVKQILEEHNSLLGDKSLLKVIYSLAKSGHSQYLPDIFNYMKDCDGFKNDVLNLCFKLLAMGHEDAALQISQRFFINDSEHPTFRNQKGCFLLSQCVDLKMPMNLLKNFASKLQESGMHQHPLQYALFCALDNGDKEYAFDIMRAMKRSGLPVKPHYCYPLLTSCKKSNDVQGTLEILKAMHDLKVQFDTEAFILYGADCFKDGKTAQSILEKLEFREGFNKLYMSAVREGLNLKYYSDVCKCLSSDIPFTRTLTILRSLSYQVSKCQNPVYLAQITNLLFFHGSKQYASSNNAESLGHFLNQLIDNMSDSDTQEREGPLADYFQKLKDMGISVDANKGKSIIALLESRNVPELTKAFSGLLAPEEPFETLEALQAKLEWRKANNLEYSQILWQLLQQLIEEEDLPNALELTWKYSDSFTLPMFAKVLGLCCKMSQPTEALKIKQEINKRGFESSLTFFKYIDYVDVMLSNGFVEDAINALKEMKERNVPVEGTPEKKFFFLLQTLAKHGNADAVNQLFELVVSLKLAEPSSKFCSPLIDVHLQRNDLSSAFDALLMCHKKYKCSPLSYQLMLKTIQAGDTELLKKIVDHVNSQLGEVHMLHDLIFAFIESGKYAEAQEIAETPGLRAHLKKINWFIFRLVENNMVEALENLLEVSKNLYNCNRTDIYYHLVSLYASNKDWKKIEEIWPKMKNDILIKGDIFTLLLTLVKENQNEMNKIPELLELLDNQLDMEIQRDIRKLIKDKMIDEAYLLLLKHPNIALSKATFSKLIKGLMETGQLESASKVDEVAKSQYADYSMESVSSNLLLAQQLGRDCLKDALVTTERMLADDSMPSQNLLNKLTNALAIKGDVESLQKLEVSINQSNLLISKIDIQIQNCILLAHFRNGNYQEATSMMEEICTENPHYSIVSVLRKLQENDLNEAIEKVSIVAERLNNQFSVSFPVRELFLHYVLTRQSVEAKELLQRCRGLLENRDFFKYFISRKIFNSQTEIVHRLLHIMDDPFYKEFGYNSLLKSYTSHQKLDNAVSLYEKMEAEQIQPHTGHLKRLAILLTEAGMPVSFSIPQKSVKSLDAEHPLDPEQSLDTEQKLASVPPEYKY